MGQAKIRKKNGTYPFSAQIAQMSDPRLIYLKDKSYRAAVCIHEAAHADYMEQIGDVYVRFVPLPDGEHANSDALVTNDKTASEDLLQMKANLLGYVKTIVAAGIAEEVLTGQDGFPDHGSGLDDEEVEAVFDTLGLADEERVRILIQAYTDIFKDLRSPAFRKRLWRRARFYQRILEQSILEKSKNELAVVDKAA
jgi:hypothetical protein